MEKISNFIFVNAMSSVFATIMTSSSSWTSIAVMIGVGFHTDITVFVGLLAVV